LGSIFWINTILRREKKKEIYIVGAQKWESDKEKEILSTVDTEFLIHGE
jgi:hypothetical protein